MDQKTLTKLEFNKIKDMLAAMASFEGGMRKIWELEPVSSPDTVNLWLDETEEAMERLRFSEPAFLSGLKILDSHLARVRSGGTLSAAELRDINRCLASSRQAINYTSGKKMNRLGQLTAVLEPNPDLERKLHDAISDEGDLRDDASAALKTIRSQINTLRLRIKDYLQDFIRSANNQKYLQEALVTERDGRYVVPVRQEFRYEVRGIVHDESSSGATVFIEPLPVVEQNNRIRSLQMEEKREVERILRELTLKVAMFVDEIEYNMKILSQLDLIMARARLAYKMNAYRPEINNRGIIEISRARHPLLGPDAVPVNMELGKSFDTLVITGPNTGGKTVVLKTIGLLTVMAMCGLFVPARENSRISIFNSIYVDIGDEQSIEQSLSTFSSHIKNIIAILNKVNDRSLVLLDELGAGTDPVEGAALARVILEDMRKKKAKVVVTTHQSELKNYAFGHDRVQNACVEFDPVSLRPTYELSIGMPGQSNAMAIAARLGLKKELVNEARRLVPENEMEIGNMLRQLKESRTEYDNLSRELETRRQELIEERESFNQEREEYIREQEEIVQRIRSEANTYLKEIKAEAGDVVDELRELLKDREKPPKWHEIEQKRQRLKKMPSFEPESAGREIRGAQDIKAGDFVIIKEINQKGYVLDGPNQQGEVMVQAGILRLSVKTDQLVKGDSPEEKAYRHRNETFLEKVGHISKEIDVRGHVVDDALVEIDKYLEDANLVGLTSVAIIHGKGTGALRRAVRDYLRDHRYVKAFRDGMMAEGGHGVTIVELR
ncbi:MAG: endonuclease MutS2 [Deltaproteobacteria bacterium]